MIMIDANALISRVAFSQIVFTSGS